MKKHPSEHREAPAKLVEELIRRSRQLATPNPDIAPVVGMYNPESHIEGSFLTTIEACIVHVTLRYKDEEYITGVLDLRFLDIDKDLSEHMFNDTLNGLLLLSPTFLSGTPFWMVIVQHQWRSVALATIARYFPRHIVNQTNYVISPAEWSAFWNPGKRQLQGGVMLLTFFVVTTREIYIHINTDFTHFCCFQGLIRTAWFGHNPTQFC